MDQLLATPRPEYEGSWTLTDEEFLKSLEWGRGPVAGEFRPVAKEGDVREFARLLERQLRRLFPLTKPGKNGSGAVTPTSVLWSQPAFDSTPRMSTLIEIVSKLISASDSQPNSGLRKPRNQKRTASKKAKNSSTISLAEQAVIHWLDQLDRSEPLTPFERLLVSDLLRRSPGQFSRGTAFRLWRLLLEATLCDFVEQAEYDEGNPKPLTDRELVAEGELPFALSILFSGLRVAEEQRERGRRALSESILAGTDETGMPRADLLERLSFWMATFVRARDWGAQAGVMPWDGKSERRFKLFAQAASMMLRSDGRLPLSNGFIASSVDLLSSASQLAGLKVQSAPRIFLQELSDARLFQRKHKRRKGGLRPRRIKRGRAAVSNKSAEKFPAAQSDWARLACLRSGWSVDADTLIVAHHEPMPRIELSALGKPLLSGRWDLSLSLDSTPLEFTSEWNCVCWFSDEDADYIELRIDHPDGVRVERQLLLSRDDHFALFAEIVTGPDGTPIECESRFSPVAGASIVPDRPTRECRLKVPACSARVFPLMLPAERTLGAAGSFGLVDDALQLRQTGIGGLYAPIVIDWNPDRTRAYAEWKKLTVTEQGQKVASHLAGGCRLRVGTDQWLFYHGMRRSQGGRAILGQHTFNETLIGRFTEDGTVEPILLVEPQEV